MSQGIFISFEGIDGAGKSSHIDALASLLQQQGYSVTRSREPGGTELAEQLRQLVLNHPMDALTEALLVFAARRDHVQQVIRPALQRGDVVLCDRFADASFAYQGGGRGVDWATLLQLEQWVQSQQGAVLQPDLTIWFDLPPAVAAARLVQARTADRFESQPEDFFHQVVQGYARRQQADPQRFARIAADQPREQVWADVCQALVQRGWLR
ncbi:dTMP kinase [Curvibacter sp. CHRR-16]|uniref:dTMP kinase n=1 Tax=Curvibacter sp. CHRR-16 TaxID=2835872 RepID=UPI001BDB52F9|nr:dTMP kinase [Curvibacter sp. CHRR-16]MBT0571238.1 dTMP kinase [Curvibacter sp. CHRR-16]